MLTDNSLIDFLACVEAILAHGSSQDTETATSILGYYRLDPFRYPTRRQVHFVKSMYDRAMDHALAECGREESRNSSVGEATSRWCGRRNTEC